MTTSSTRATLALLAGTVLACTVWPALVQAQDNPSKDANTSGAAAKKLVPAGMRADEVFAGIAQKLDGIDSLSCTIQQSITMSGHRFLAAGDFTQATGNRIRLQYRVFPVRPVKAADKADLALDGGPEDTTELKETGSLTQVSDGSVLWSYWVNAKDKQLTRRNIQEIVTAVSELPNDTRVQNLESLGVGGLKAVMSQLQAGMEFGTVQQQTVGDSQVLVLSGRWSRKTRETVFGLPAGQTNLPEYMPDFVRVYVDAEMMLPRRIQYLKRHPNPGLKQVRPLVTMDFRNIRLNGEIPADVFTFTRPDDKELVDQDLTKPIIESIKSLAAAGSPTELPGEQNGNAGAAEGAATGE